MTLSYSLLLILTYFMYTPVNRPYNGPSNPTCVKNIQLMDHGTGSKLCMTWLALRGTAMSNQYPADKLQTASTSTESSSTKTPELRLSKTPKLMHTNARRHASSIYHIILVTFEHTPLCLPCVWPRCLFRALLVFLSYMNKPSELLANIHPASSPCHS